MHLHGAGRRSVCVLTLAHDPWRAGGAVRRSTGLGIPSTHSHPDQPLEALLDPLASFLDHIPLGRAALHWPQSFIFIFIFYYSPPKGGIIKIKIKIKSAWWEGGFFTAYVNKNGWS